MTPEQWRLTKELFEQALALPKAQWDAFLEKECGDDQVVRDKTLDMLTSHSQTSEFMEDSNINVDLFSGSTDSADRYVGQQIGLYRIEHHVGEGGMGHVYLAERMDDFHKKVALKIIKRGMDSDALLSRFRQERQILANLVHPNIARLLDGGSADDGLPYLVMEYIEGVPITDYCDQHKLTIAQRLKLFGEVCQAISFAHQNLVIHRDIKPSNIIVTGEGIPKLLDFGIAKLLDPQEQQTPEFTMHAAHALTPEYASPEQIQRKAVTTASDVYALGVLLYTLLAGRRPYHFEDRSPSTIEKIIATTMPASPSTTLKNAAVAHDPKKLTENGSPEHISRLRDVSPEKLRRQLQGDLDNIVLKALQKEPERRYASVEQFFEDINRHLSGLPVHARKDTVGYRTTKFINRHHLGFAVAMIVLLITIAAVAGIAWQGQIARQEAKKAQQTLEFVKQMLEAADPLEAGKELSVEQLLDEATERIAKELKEQPEVETEIRSILGQAYQNLGHYDKAQPHLEKNLDLLRDHYGGEHSLLANGHRELAVLQHYKGELLKADSLYQKAIDLYRRIGETTSGDYAVSLNDYGTILLDQAKLDSAVIIFEKSLKIMGNALGENHYQMGSVLNNLAFAYDDKGDNKNADRIYNQALDVFRHNYGDEHPEIANTLNNYAFVKLSVGDTLASLNMHQQALDMWRKLLGNDHPDIGLTLHNIAAVTFYQKKYAQAETKEREVVKVFRKNYPADHPYLGNVYFMMGRILNAQEKFSEAQRFLQDALIIRKAKLDSGHHLIGGAYLELGRSLLGMNQQQNAEEMLLKAHQVLSEAGESEKMALNRNRELLVELYEKQGKSEAAERFR